MLWADVVNDVIADFYQPGVWLTGHLKKANNCTE